MDSRAYLSPAEAARRLGVTAKALRVYEHHGLLTPVRTASGWRTYGSDQMRRGAEIVALRDLGFSLAQIVRMLDGGDSRDLEPALAAQQAMLETELRKLSDRIGRVRGLRHDLARGVTPPAQDVLRLLQTKLELSVVFDLPWPWGGERFEFRHIRRLTHIVGPLGSGKTRLAQCLAKALPNAVFLGLERAADTEDPDRTSRVDRAIAWIVEDGGSISDALRVLIAGLEAEAPGAFVIDMIEQGLDHATQEALIAYLRHGRGDPRPLLFLTRSSAILDLAAVGPEEAIILCPPNHSPPVLVAPYPGAPGYETVAACLATPEVRARTAGVIALRPSPS